MAYNELDMALTGNSYQIQETNIKIYMYPKKFTKYNVSSHTI